MTYELMIIIDIKNNICTTKKGLKSLIRADENFIDITEKYITYKNEKFSCDIKKEKIEKNTDIIAYILKIDFSEEQIETFSEMKRALKIVIGKITGKNKLVLWDDLSLYYSQKLYPQIYEVENLLRKLINLFMVTKVGLEWEKEAGINVVIANQNKNKGSGNGIVYELDFSILTNILFGKYPIKSIELLENAIKDMELSDTPLDGENHSIIQSFEDFIPKNNWDRYFSKLLNCESKEFKKKWDTLYSIRCVVAHNNSISKEQYNQGIEHCEWLKEVLGKAIKQLTEINIPDEEIESAVFNPIYGDNNDLRTARKSHVDISPQSAKSFIETQSKIKNYLPVSVSDYLQATRNIADYLPVSVSDYLQAARNIADYLPVSVSDYLQAARNIADYLPVSNNGHLESLTNSKDSLSELSKAGDNGMNNNSLSGEDKEKEEVGNLKGKENNEE